MQSRDVALLPKPSERPTVLENSNKPTLDTSNNLENKDLIRSCIQFSNEVISSFNEYILNQRLSNPDLHDKDKLLLNKYKGLSEKEGTTAKEIEKIKDKIESRYLELYINSLKNFSGNENFVELQKSFYAFQHAIEALQVFDENEIKLNTNLLYDRVKKYYKELYSIREDGKDENLKIINAFIEGEVSEKEEDFLGKLKESFEKLFSSVVGTNERKRYLITCELFKLAAEIKEIEPNKFYSALYGDLYDELSSFISDIESTPEKYDDYLLLLLLLPTYSINVEDYYKAVYEEKPNLIKINELVLSIKNLRSFFELCGINPAKLDSFEEKISSKYMLDNPFVLTPEELPDEIKHKLANIKINDIVKDQYNKAEISSNIPKNIKTKIKEKLGNNSEKTAFDFVKENVKAIIFTDKMPGERETQIFTGGSSDGVTIHGGIIFVRKQETNNNTADDKDKEKDKELENLIQASVILHEAAHCFWNKNYDLPQKIREKSTLNEHFAYSFSNYLIKDNYFPEVINSFIGENLAKNQNFDKLELEAYPTKYKLSVVFNLANSLIDVSNIKAFFMLSNIFNTLVNSIPDHDKLEKEVNLKIENLKNRLDRDTLQLLNTIELISGDYSHLVKMLLLIINPEFNTKIDEFQSIPGKVKETLFPEQQSNSANTKKDNKTQ